MDCRLLYLVGQLGPGGLERQLYYLLQAMDRERYKPAVVVWNYCENDPYVSQIRALGVPLYSFPKASTGAVKLRAFRRIVEQTRPEVVHSFSFYTNFPAWWAVLGTKIVAIGAVRSDFTRAKKEAGLWLGRLSARWPRVQIFNSSAAAEIARHSHSPFVPQQLFIIRNAIDLQRFRNVPLPLTPERVRIVGVGSLLPIKRWDRLLAVALELKRRNFDYLMQIAGDGPLRRSLEQQARDLLIDNVEFIGHSDDIPGLLNKATFVVHTSDSEGCPNVVLEAMACGRAVVATDAGDVPSLIEDERTGFIVRRGDDVALVSRCVTLITDRDLCHRMGRAGRAKAEREFGLDRLVTETLAAYRAAGWRDVQYA